MKSSMPFLGVPVPEVRKLTLTLCRAQPPLDFPTWVDTVLSLYRGAKYREERYAALGITGFRPYREFHVFRALPLYEELIVTGAWWDLVDEASTRVGWILERSPQEMRGEMLAWAHGSNLWKRRTSIICQRQRRERTDLELLYACIEPSLGDREFFLQKAIGWALRDVAWFDPREALRYVRAHRHELSPLAKREALKNLLKQGVVNQLP
jgi:3-methyladenine DNA glycosylase AlkD